jgi:hypothetical protein
MEFCPKIEYKNLSEKCRKWTFKKIPGGILGELDHQRGVVLVNGDELLGQRNDLGSKL